jgi:hypothetical protein
MRDQFRGNRLLKRKRLWKEIKGRKRRRDKGKKLKEEG